MSGVDGATQTPLDYNGVDLANANGGGSEDTSLRDINASLPDVSLSDIARTVRQSVDEGVAEAGLDGAGASPDVGSESGGPLEGLPEEAARALEQSDLATFVEALIDDALEQAGVDPAAASGGGDPSQGGAGQPVGAGQTSEDFVEEAVTALEDGNVEDFTEAVSKAVGSKLGELGAGADPLTPSGDAYDPDLDDLSNLINYLRRLGLNSQADGLEALLSSAGGADDPGSGAVGSGGSGNDGSTAGGSSPGGDGSVGGSDKGVGPVDDSNGVNNGPVTTTPSGGSGEFKLGDTNVEIQGGTPEQRAKVEESFIAMYESSPEFKDKIDAKADSGINVGFEEFGGNVAAKAEVGGSNMWMDSSYMNGGSQDIAEVIAHEVGHLDGMNHGSELDNYSSRAAQAVA